MIIAEIASSILRFRSTRGYLPSYVEISKKEMIALDANAREMRMHPWQEYEKPMSYSICGVPIRSLP